MLENKKNNQIKAGLYIVATPIGNLEDITFRALEVLRNSDYILCEDTRHSIKILNHYKIKTKLVAFHQHNETKNLLKIFNDIKEGKVISLISDAGTPLISDPGETIVKKAREERLNVTPIPGPSAAIASVSVAGFDAKFYFYGFLSKKNNIRKTELETLSELSCTIVLYVPARDLKKTLKDLSIYLPAREVFVAREVTKIHETYYKGYPDDLLDKVDKQSEKGEITIVISNKSVELKNNSDETSNLNKEIKLLINKMSSKDIAEYLSNKMNISKKIIYQNILKLNS